MAATARSVNDDPFQNHRFHIFDTAGFFSLVAPAAGFNSISMPELNLDIGEYREGLWTYSRKQPIRPHFTVFTLHKGVVKTDSSFYKLAKAAAEGKPYRTDVSIKQFHRTDVAGLIDYRNAIPTREIRCYNCTPARNRPSSDLDSLNSDIMIEEMDLDPEEFRLFINGVEVAI